MTNALNISIVEGRIVRNADLLYTKNSHAVCKFDLAINESYKVENESKTVTSFITVNLWDKYAESMAKFLEKGKAVRVTGAIKQNSWEDKNNVKHNDLYINATNIDFLNWAGGTKSE